MDSIKLTDENGIEKEYKVVFAYQEPNQAKGYLVYADGEKNYLASYNPLSDDLNLASVTDPAEIQRVKDLMVKAGGVE